ncbi:putative peptidoglycan binding protein [Sediminihabitans luteus]|uniref:Putative peptidoglycan binding protein n=1 Tax=Sediminihabitans luteus TaxID=1138585 RepID=A0A2M9CEE0_9CELL|nr:peptidoglycan-binding domain-containing protein [Sediminihabitans luteus]PJJ70316.1 putative peptidoglycan binding protein [Sediminihabitans luteus]GII97787.1 hypothetical protein Slu03_01650 [Sediminihabitans luteus]
MKTLHRTLAAGAAAALLATGALAGATSATAASAAYSACSTTVTVGGVTVPATPAPWISPTAKSTWCSISPRPDHLGVQGPGVAALQRHIESCYGISAGPRGVYGTGFVSALTSVQSAAGDGPDGVYGPSTRDRMKFRPDNGGPCVTVAFTS